MAVVAFLSFVATPADNDMGDTVRLIYVHVPIVSIAYLGIVTATIGSVMFLWKNSAWWDLVAAVDGRGRARSSWGSPW